MPYVQPSRVKSAIENLAAWAESARSQNAQHVLPLLALLEKGVSTNSFTQFSEADDFAFWDKYCRMPGEARQKKDAGEHTKSYYIDPLTRVLRDADHPHRSPSTFRKRTFANSWKAGEFREESGTVEWKLSPQFASIISQKMLTKGGVPRKIPALDMAAYLLRDQQLPAGATASVLAEAFQQRFKLSPEDFAQLFKVDDEPAENIFTANSPPAAEMSASIKSSLREVDVDEEPEQKSGAEKGSMLPRIAADDSVLLQVHDLLAFGTSGIIFEGPPGTGKSWYARQIAQRLVENTAEHIFQVQFHPSYGYEDFVEGMVPDQDSKSGFKVQPKIFQKACSVAAPAKKPPKLVVLLIDEINRGDPARVFGECLTYIERAYRDQPFTLPYSQKPFKIPANLLLLGTMNPFDKSIAQLDQAFIRRFDHVELKPDPDVVGTLLRKTSGLTEPQVERIVKFFQDIQPEVEGGIGHAFFAGVHSTQTLRLVWNFRIMPYVESLLMYEATRLKNLSMKFDSFFNSLTSS